MIDACHATALLMAALVASAQAGVFARLSDPTLFAQASVEHGAVTWSGGLNLAPDAMYAAIAERGEWKIAA
ncbi:MAG: hypothetical protein WCC64_09695 [Aliidongia sp.]